MTSLVSRDGPLAEMVSDAEALVALAGELCDRELLAAAEKLLGAARAHELTGLAVDAAGDEVGRLLGAQLAAKDGAR